jgi:hypothetical protein
MMCGSVTAACQLCVLPTGSSLSVCVFELALPGCDGSICSGA